MEKEIKVITRGNLSLKIPIFRYGKGSPKTLIISGVHGDEATGLLILKELAKKLDKKSSKGTVTLIPSVNPLSREFNRRANPISGNDLNRLVGKAPEGSLEESLLDWLISLCQGQDLVIDIHTLQPHAKVIGVFMNAGGESIRERCKGAILTFGPDFIWQLSPQKKAEIQFSGALGPNLSLKGIANFAVELPEPETMNIETQNRIVEGISYLIFEHQKRNALKVPTIERILVKAKGAGLFTPIVALGGRVKKGAVVGEMVLPNLEGVPIKAETAGVLLSHVGKKQVKEGGELFSLGREI